MNIKLNKVALAIGAMVVAGGAMAVDNTTSTVGSTARIAAECAVGNSASNALAFTKLDMLNFGTAAQSEASNKASSTFNAICTKGTTSPKFAYVSANAVGTDFRLIGGTTASETIVYSLYPSATSTGTAIVGGEATGHPGFVTPDGTTQSLPLSAEILAGAKNGKSVQSYSDTITITVTFG